MGGRLVVDTETDGLLQACTRCWLVNVKNIDTGVCNAYLEGDLGWKDELDNADIVIGHNIEGYDLPVLWKLFKYKPPKSVSIHDTLLLSLVTNYKRFGENGHSLAVWGTFLGYPKGDFNDFTRYSPEMQEYCDRDVLICEKIYKIVISELKALISQNSNTRTYIKAEHAVARWCAMAELNGWPFDKPAAEALLARIGAVMDETRQKLMPLLGYKTVAVDKKNGEVLPKKPKWTKIGAYAAHTANWFDIDPFTGQDENRLVEGDYSRVTFEPLEVDSIADMKIFLFRNNWVPTDYNYKVNEITGKKERTSPKITEDSLECMHGNGKIYCDFLTNKSRYSILKGWIEACKDNGRLHGECFTIGTPSMRARHSLIVNVPAADSVWGPEMRKLFTCSPGWKLIGCDSTGNQARGLAHYLKSPEFVHTLLNGDIHQRNADIATEVLATVLGMTHTVTRARAKRILYAFLFGASGGKLWSYIFDVINEELGKKFKSGFIKAIPGFKPLLEKLENIYGKTRQYGSGGYIIGLGGNRIYCDSFHKLLVYLLQAAEKATCAVALMLTAERLEEAGIPYEPCIFMHDEIDFQVPEEFAEQAKEIGQNAFMEGPKLLGVQIMAGEGKIGNNWYEVH
jgi:DNA polymerase-1